MHLYTALAGRRLYPDRLRRVSWEASYRWLLESWPARRLAGVVLHAQARHRVIELDHLDATRCQARILRGLVHRGHASRFGRDHDFRRIRTPEDFRRLVPLRTPAELEATCAPSGRPRALWSHHRRAARSALALFMSRRLRARLVAGPLLLVGSEPGRAVQGAPALARVHMVAATGADRIAASQVAQLPPAVVAGPADQLARYLSDVKAQSGSEQLRDAWPGLQAVFYGSVATGAGRAALLRQLGASADLALEVCWLADGAIAVEDPRRGALHLLVDEGVFFEFVPPGEVGDARPTRHTVADIEPGVAYRVVMTSPAGTWACLTGVTVRFERREPPLLHVIELPAGVGYAPARPALAAWPRPSPAAPAPRPQTDGNPAAPPGTSARSLWSARAGRG